MSNIDNLSILETALAIRSHLSELLDPQTAAQVRQQLDQLLQQLHADTPSEDDIEDQIWDLLTGTKATQTWATQFQKSTSQKAYNSLPGNPSTISFHRFKCSQCDYTWSRDRVGRPTPFCPTHQVPLELTS